MAIIVAVVVALIPATWFTAQRAFDGAARSARSNASTDLPIPPVTPSATANGEHGTTSSAQPVVPATTTPVELPAVAPAAPRRIVADGLIDTGFDNAVTDIAAGSTSEVARWETRGSPGSPGTDTVFVFGKLLSSGNPAAFTGLPRLEVGDEVILHTDEGRLTYTVRTTTLRPDEGLLDDPAFTAHQPGRLVMVGLRYAASGDRLDDHLVVTAELTGATKA